jgi:hypothetical protein
MPVSDRTVEERARARQRLRELAAAPLTLAREVYFVPGWRDERGECWKRMEEWMPYLVANWKTHVHYVQFLEPGDKLPEFEDFLDFGDDLAELVMRDVGSSGREVDFVCHSMGGLDTFAAIALLDDHPELSTDALRCAHTVIAYDTPFLGFAAAGNALFKKFVESGRKDPWAMLQLAAMEEESKRIAEVKRARDRFLSRVTAFWPRGADNYDGLLEVSHESASFGERDDFAPEVRDRYHEYSSWPDTSHSGANGVTRDLRAVVETVEILAGVKTT